MRRWGPDCRHLSLTARQALPRLASVLTSGATGPDNTDDTMAVACHTVRKLLKVEPEMGKTLLNNILINSLVDLSKNRCTWLLG